MIRDNDIAVSPVVGVMLMLVVTIIIAAVVSGFAGGMVKDTKKPPQATISASFSQSQGMELFHNGGDTLSTQAITLIVKPSRSFGNYEHLTWVVNKSVIRTNEKQWVNESEPYVYNLARIFQAGDTAKIATIDLPYIQEKNNSTDDYLSPVYGFGCVTYSVGSSFILTVNDESGKPIASTEVQIKP